MSVYVSRGRRRRTLPQVTLYLDPETNAKARAAAEAAEVSLSRWLGELGRAHAEDTWPQHLRALAGSLPAFPDAESLRDRSGPGR